MADQGQGYVDGGTDVDHPGPIVLYEHIWLGAFCWLPGPVAGAVRRTVSQGPGVQHSADHRILLDHAHRTVRFIRWHIQGGI